MSEFFDHTFVKNVQPIVFMLTIIWLVVIPIRDQMKRVGIASSKDSRRIFYAIVFKHMIFPVALMIFFGGIMVAANVSGPIWPWVCLIGSLLVAGGVCASYYVGPFYPLVHDLEDAEDRAR